MTETKKFRLIAEYISKGINPILLNVHDRWDNNNLRYVINLQDCLDFLDKKEQENIIAAFCEYLTRDFKDLQKRIEGTGVYMGYLHKDVTLDFQDSYDKAKAQFEEKNPGKTFEQYQKELADKRRRDFNSIVGTMASSSVMEDIHKLSAMSKNLDGVIGRKYHR